MYRVVHPAHHKRVPVPKSRGRPFILVRILKHFSPLSSTYLTRRVDFRGVPFRFVLQVDFETFVWKFGFFECKLSLPKCFFFKYVSIFKAELRINTQTHPMSPWADLVQLKQHPEMNNMK